MSKTEYDLKAICILPMTHPINCTILVEIRLSGNPDYHPIMQADPCVSYVSIKLRIFILWKPASVTKMEAIMNFHYICAMLYWLQILEMASFFHHGVIRSKSIYSTHIWSWTMLTQTGYNYIRKLTQLKYPIALHANTVFFNCGK